MFENLVVKSELSFFLKKEEKSDMFVFFLTLVSSKLAFKP